jgi:hypothetical protein
MKGSIQRYNTLVDRINKVQMAQSQLSMGITPAGFADLLGPGAAGSGGAASVPGAGGKNVNMGKITADFLTGKLSQAEIMAMSALTPGQKAAVIAAKKAADKKPGSGSIKTSGKKTSDAGPVNFEMTPAQRDSSMRQTGRAVGEAATATGKAVASVSQSNLKAVQQANYNRTLAAYGPDSFLTIQAKKALDALNE